MAEQEGGIAGAKELIIPGGNITCGEMNKDVSIYCELADLTVRHGEQPALAVGEDRLVEDGIIQKEQMGVGEIFINHGAIGKVVAQEIGGTFDSDIGLLIDAAVINGGIGADVGLIVESRSCRGGRRYAVGLPGLRPGG